MNRATAFQLPVEGPGVPHARPETATQGNSTPEIPAVLALNSSVVLICPDETGRRNLSRACDGQRATILREFTAYPSYAQLPSLLEFDCDAFLVEVDSDADVALDLVEAICTRKPSATVMVYSVTHNSDQMVFAMRAGAREFLTATTPPTDLRDALLRAVARHSEHAVKKTRGKLLVFWGAKGGSGATTLATNFAIALRMETGAEVALVDLNPDLGEIAVLLGVTPRFTVAEALQNARRLDHEFITTLMTEHPSGVSILAAPESYNSSLRCESRAVGKLLDVLGTEYPYVVVDAGRSLGEGVEPLFEMADTIYMVTQLDIPSLRNTQRFISHIQAVVERHIEVVVNRAEAHHGDFDDDRVARALGLRPKWKVPNDFAAVQRSSNAGTPLILEKSPVAGALRTMARVAAGHPATPPKKKGWGLFA